MQKNNQPVLSFDNERLIFNGHAHYVTGVLASVSSSAPIAIHLADIQLDDPSEKEIEAKVKIALAKVEPSADILDDRADVLVYKHNNRYYVLTGKERIKHWRSTGESTFHVKLVSSPALKKARVQPEMISSIIEPRQSIQPARRPTYGGTTTSGRSNVVAQGPGRNN